MRQLLITFCLMLGVYGTLSAQEAVLQGTITGLPVNTKLILQEVVQGNKIVPCDSCVVPESGDYSFREKVSQPAFYLMTLSVEKSPTIHIFLLPSEQVSLDMRYSQGWNHIRITGVKGSRNMELYRRFNNLIPVGQDEAAQWNLKVNVADLVTEYSDCLMSAFMVTFFEEDFTSYGGLYKLVYDKLAGKYPDNTFVQHLADRIRTSVVPGMMAPDIALNDPYGKERKLSDLRGKVVLLDFWASWCGPCRKENPNVVQLYKRFHSQGFEIYSVSLDKSKDAWTKAIMDDGLIWDNHVSDLQGWSSAGGKIYGISSVPATVLIDRDGKVVARNLRGPELENKVQELMRQ